MVNSPAFFLSHRLPVALAARETGFEVHVATPTGDAVEDIRGHGFIHHAIPLSRSGKNPLVELRSLWRLVMVMRRVRPAIVHLVTIKPVLYGGMVARALGVPGMVAAISGLGAVFIARGAKARMTRALVRVLYKRALGHRNAKVIFQNRDDRATMVDLGIVRPEQTVLIPGSGVSLAEFAATPEPTGVPVVSMASRLLKDKGVMEYVAAAGMLAQSGVQAEFRLIGDRDPGNPAALSREEVAEIEADPAVVLLGFRRDIPDLLAHSNIVALPSYREGLPRALIEAAACGRAVVTTDVPGCRDAIEADVTGLLVPVRDARALANALRQLIEDPARRGAMGRAGRRRAEQLFAIERIVDQHLQVYAALESPWSRPHER